MKVLVVGSGGREHALVWKIRQSKKVEKVYCAPGNAGIKKNAQCVDIAATDVKGLLKFAKENGIHLTVVGPESALAAGIADAFAKEGLRIFGPDQEAAMLERSKVFAKEFMARHKIPTAEFKVFSDAKKAKRYIDKQEMPIVVKADGLAAGKGVIVAATADEAKQAVDSMMTDQDFGEAGSKIVIESCLEGEEASFIAFTDGKTVLPMPSSQDHKAVFEDDKGPNTGGMGAYSPAPVVTDQITDYVMEKVMLPAVKGMAAEGITYKGVLYAGLMIHRGRVNVLEFNCRFGDPEAQPLLMRLKSDLVDIMAAVIDEQLEQVKIKIDPRPTVCVVMASGGYPGGFEAEKNITGIQAAGRIPGVEIFHAGTSRKNGHLVNSGGRVLGVTAVGKNLGEAVKRAYRAVDKIHWSKCYYRNDIAHKALGRMRGFSPMVGIIMGSDSDLPIMKAASSFLISMDIPYEITVASAHRTPDKVMKYAAEARERGIRVIIAGAGMSAHLAGVIASHTDLPVIGVPIDASPLNGLDALLSTVQMPPGVPVATMGIGRSGAKNAAVFAARMLAADDKELEQRLVLFREDMVREVEEKSRNIE